MASPARIPKEQEIKEREAAPGDSGVQSEVAESSNQAAIATRAYELWEARGCHIGSPELDWLHAEEELLESLKPRKG
jgi:hypothetical protein